MADEQQPSAINPNDLPRLWTEAEIIALIAKAVSQSQAITAAQIHDAMRTAGVQFR